MAISDYSPRAGDFEERAEHSLTASPTTGSGSCVMLGDTLTNCLCATQPTLCGQGGHWAGFVALP